MAKLRQSSEALFPILPSQPVGMARLAAEATHADAGHLVEFKAMEARSILNRSVSKRSAKIMPAVPINMAQATQKTK